MSLARCTVEEKDSRLADLARFKEGHASEAPAAIEAIKSSALEGGNLFETIMEVAPVLTLGQITTALFEVGGKYRRSV
jgi:methylmalonyl-CoA mutase